MSPLADAGPDGVSWSPRWAPSSSPDATADPGCLPAIDAPRWTQRDDRAGVHQLSGMGDRSQWNGVGTAIADVRRLRCRSST